VSRWFFNGQKKESLLMNYKSKHNVLLCILTLLFIGNCLPLYGCKQPISQKIDYNFAIKPYKFTLIGLPGVGKSTTLRECAKLLQIYGIACNVKSTDDIIRSRFNACDPIIIRFEKEILKEKIPDSILKVEGLAPEIKIAAFMQKFGEEPAWRDLEEMFIKDIVESADDSDWFDLGGKAPLRKGTLDILHAHNIIPIFLDARSETIFNRLTNDDNWKTRAAYFSAGIDGWPKIAEEHRSDRQKKYCEIASIIISVEQSENEETNHTIKLKTSEEIAHEIFYKIGLLHNG